ncbi:MAG TPA: helix-turn-helix domain-containing protein [Candidatus Baltobacteraceae bacterium]|nr:helix-turn-helix domain-containing protein [Candidatus Baltobacteraceae bacterium]
MEKCSVTKTMDVIGGKWKSVALYYMLAAPRRFNELKRLMPSITQRMLTLQLRELERDGLITRTIFPEVPPRVEYALTDLGKTLEPILQLLCSWGGTYAKRVYEIRDDRVA